tara:strand:- start:1456 stop:2331 length:876 start_codon:yes stop_codon:yes gene_type:complete
MATIDLGKIKLVNRGAYNNSTAYTVDDLVQSGGSTYICIQNSTGNAVTNNSYWSVLAQGGTDVGTTLTTQGDILYRDGSGLQRLAAGTANQVLKTGGAGANPSWGTLSSDWVRLHTETTSGAVTSISVDGHYSSDYLIYKYFLFNPSGSSTQNWIKSRFNFGGSADSSTNYRTNLFYSYRNTSSNGEGNNVNDDDGLHNYAALSWWASGDNEGVTTSEVLVVDPQSTSSYKLLGVDWFGHDNGNTMSFGKSVSRLANNQSTASTGMTFLLAGSSGETFSAGFKVVLYGLKT